MRRLPCLVLPIVLALAAACADPAGSERGTYVLRTVGDSTVPFATYDVGTTRSIELGDTISLDGRGGSRESIAWRLESAGQAPSTSSSVTTRRYSMRGDTVEFVFTCPGDAPCLLPLYGYELVAGGIATFPLQPANPANRTSFFERIR